MPDGKFRERLRHVCGYCKLTRGSKKDMPTSRRYPISNSFLVIASRVCGLVAIVVRPVSHTPERQQSRRLRRTLTRVGIDDHHETVRLARPFQ
jgi:hypothetical protein